MSGLTKSQREALKWLADHNGDGLFDKNGVLLAGGETAPHTRTTWNALRQAGCCELYGAGRGRLRVTLLGMTEIKTNA